MTPDPAVIEANLAPASSLDAFYLSNAALFAAAEDLGLCPYRLHYNGGEADSGGGGQLTLGGPSAELSPFFVEPHLLPRLVRYFNRHPSLSYWQAPDSIGSGSQAPRADEGRRSAGSNSIWHSSSSNAKLRPRPNSSGRASPRSWPIRPATATAAN